MRVVNMDHLGGRQVDAFGSRNFTVFHLLPQAHVVAASVGPGGSIGEHPAVVDQLPILVAGRAIVAGGDGRSRCSFRQIVRAPFGAERCLPHADRLNAVTPGRIGTRDPNAGDARGRVGKESLRCAVTPGRLTRARP